MRSGPWPDPSIMIGATFPMRRLLPLLFATLLPGQAPISAAEFGKLSALVVPRTDGAWQSIPWRTDLLAARAEAAASKRPLFLWSMNGHPLGRT